MVARFLSKYIMQRGQIVHFDIFYYLYCIIYLLKLKVHSKGSVLLPQKTLILKHLKCPLSS